MTCHYNFCRSFILSYYCSMISQVVYAVLENYESPYANADNDDVVEDIRIQWVDEVLKARSNSW
jgi:protein EFR3